MPAPFTTNAWRLTLGTYDGDDIGVLLVDGTGAANASASNAYVSDIAADELDGPDYERGAITLLVDEDDTRTIGDADPSGTVYETDTTDTTPAGAWFYDTTGGSDAARKLLFFLPLADPGPGYPGWLLEPPTGGLFLFSKITTELISETADAAAGLVNAPYAPDGADGQVWTKTGAPGGGTASWQDPAGGDGVFASDSPPSAPETGDLWFRTAAGLVASMDYRWLPDGEVPNLTPLGDPQVPCTNGPGSAGSVPVVDPSGVVGSPLTPPAALDGALRAPANASGNTTMIPAYFVGPPATDEARITIGFADFPEASGTDVDGAGVNIPWTTSGGTGPIVHFVPYSDGGDIVTRVKVGVDHDNTAYLGSDVLLLDRLLGDGDRGALVLRKADRTWWVEINGEVLEGTECSLVDNGADDDVIVDGVTIDTVTGHLDFDDLEAASTPTSGSADDWRAGYRWLACSEHDYDPDLIGMLRWDGAAWVRDGGETEYREAIREWVDGIPTGSGGDVAGDTHAASSKATPVDADEIPLVDSAASNVLKKLTWANLKATLKTYFDTLYQPLSSAYWPHRQRIAVNIEQPDTVSGTWSPTGNTSAGNGGYATSGTGNTESWTYTDIECAAGTWELVITTRNTTNTGIITVTLGGTGVGTVDTYSGSTTVNNRAVISPITIATSGRRSLVLTNPTKNASSSNYAMQIQHITMRRTGS